MSEENILNKYIELINKGYCSDCNELNCINNFPHKKIAKAIEQLQQENKMLKLDSKNTYETSQDIMYEMQEENESLGDSVNKASQLLRKKENKIKELNNTLSEFEKWLKEELKIVYRDCGHTHNTLQEVMDKLQELKEGKK